MIKHTYILFIICLLCSCEQKQRDRLLNREYCVNQVNLITASDSLPLIPIKTNTSYDSVLARIEQLEPATNFDNCSRVIYFAVPFALDASDEMNLRVRIYRQCPDLGIYCGPRSSITVLLNSKGQRLVEDEPHTSNEFLIQKLRESYFNYGQDIGLPEEPNETFVELKWLPDVPSDSLDKTIKTIIVAYLKLAEEYSERVYNRKICNLSPREIVSLKNAFPLNLELGFNKHDSLPPLPIDELDMEIIKRELQELEK